MSGRAAITGSEWRRWPLEMDTDRDGSGNGAATARRAKEEQR